MGDSGDYWRDIKEHRKEIKQERQSRMPDINSLLSEAGVNFEAKNDGHHYILDSKESKIDYWPSTGLWKCRSTKKQGYNIKPLLKHLKGAK